MQLRGDDADCDGDTFHNKDPETANNAEKHNNYDYDKSGRVDDVETDEHIHSS